MFDLDRATFTFACPKCRFENSATVRQVRIARRVICRGCKRELCLVDKNGSFKKGRRDVSEEIESFGEALQLEIKL
jgi:peptide subunit release factor 1 (eRF1)